MDINIVTPHGVMNYGALLQAFALQKYIRGLCQSTGLYHFDWDGGHCQESVKARIERMAQAFARRIYHKQFQAGDLAFQQFIQSFALNGDKDSKLFIVGSDQVWNPNNLGEIFSLEFASPHSCRASYAASLGIGSMTPEQRQVCARKLAHISFLSAREADGASMISAACGRPCLTHIDPIFLLTREQWYDEARPMKCEISRPFILVYMLHIPAFWREAVIKLKKATGYDVWLIDRRGYLSLMLPHNKIIRSAGPREFLWLMKNSSYVMTTSFHGTALAILFGKPFATYINPNAPSRIVHLLELFGMEDRAITPERMMPCSDFDTLSIDMVIHKERLRSDEYLRLLINKAGIPYAG